MGEDEVGLSPHSFRIGQGQRLDLLPDEAKPEEGVRSFHRLDELQADVSVLAIFQFSIWKKEPAKWLVLYSTLLPKLLQKTISKTNQAKDTK